jgi:hypothetical protein
MGDQDWETLDTQELLRRQQQQQEETMSAGVGGFAVPIGKPMRRQVPVASPPTPSTTPTIKPSKPRR